MNQLDRKWNTPLSYHSIYQAITFSMLNYFMVYPSQYHDNHYYQLYYDEQSPSCSLMASIKSLIMSSIIKSYIKASLKASRNSHGINQVSSLHTRHRSTNHRCCNFKFFASHKTHKGLVRYVLGSGIICKNVVGFVFGGTGIKFNQFNHFIMIYFLDAAWFHFISN